MKTQKGTTLVARFRKRMNETYMMPRWEYEAKCAFWTLIGFLIGLGMSGFFWNWRD